jgi:hypothetical protein
VGSPFAAVRVPLGSGRSDPECANIVSGERQGTLGTVHKLDTANHFRLISRESIPFKVCSAFLMFSTSASVFFRKRRLYRVGEVSNRAGKVKGRAGIDGNAVTAATSTACESLVQTSIIRVLQVAALLAVDEAFLLHTVLMKRVGNC